MFLQCVKGVKMFEVDGDTKHILLHSVFPSVKLIKHMSGLHMECSST